jgi:DNA-directed RNA polymerase subunit L
MTTQQMFSNINEHGNHVEFEITGVDLSIVNSLRRIILAEIPNVALAFDQLSDKNPDINFHVNNGALHNEYLGHRLSLVPFCFSEKEIETFDKEKYNFKIHVKNKTTEVVSVTTKDIEIFDDAGNKYPLELHKRVFPANPITKSHILITKLRPNLYNADNGEELHVEFKISKNIAKVHSRWCPVSSCSLYNKIDPVKCDEAIAIRIAEAEAAQGSKLTKAQIDKVTKKFDSLEKFKCFVTNEYGEANSFHFQIESECALQPKAIFTKAFDVLNEKLELFIDNLQNQSIPIHAVHENQHFYEVVVENEDYTLLNLLQSMIYNIKKRQSSQTDLEYIGYYQPHPLDNKMILKLKFKADVDVSRFLITSSLRIIDTLQQCKKEWQQSQ